MSVTKLKKDIWLDSNVDLVTLSPNFNEDENDDVLFKPKSVNISTNAKTKQFLSIHQWTAAFDIIMSMYYAKYPNSILGLIKYAYNIKAMSTQFGFHMTRSYDETFRTVDKVMGFHWAVVNNELWRTALYEHVNTSQASSNNNNYKSK